jgi:hypothetical protein
MIVQSDSKRAKMAGAKNKQLVRATFSLDEADQSALSDLANRMDVSSSWVVRQAIREFLEKYGDQGQPELALRLAAKRKS